MKVKEKLNDESRRQGKERKSDEKHPWGLTASLEDYLESILILARDNPGVRVKDISRRLQVKNSSVVSALSTLARNGLVVHEYYGKVRLTRQGHLQAKDVLRKHAALVTFLRQVVGVRAKVAQADACRIEHVVSSETLKRITRLVRKNLPPQRHRR
ncbi:MAG: metal-dependent transcriptional regulator [Candidatus Omnitrophica bacterium]|nr:metal-dependent transcriptional regulator [Candidatus Omnitrophota bacterium]